MKSTSLSLLLLALGAAPVLAAGLPILQFDRLVYDFGKTGQVESVTGSFRYRNEGDATLKIQPPVASCGCTVVSLAPDTLAPGESGELGFTLSLGQTRAMLEKRITVSSNDPDNPEISLVIKADYTPLYEVTPMILSPALARNGSASNLAVTLSRTDGKPLQIQRLVPSKPWIQARFDPAVTTNSLSGTNTVRVLVDVRADGPPRRFSEFVHIHDSDHTNAPVTMIYVYGQVLGDLALTPEALYWNVDGATKTVPASSEAQVTRRVSIRAVDGRPFTIRNPRTTLPGMTLAVTPRGDGAGYELVATLASPPAQSLAGNVTFDTSVATQTTVEVPFVVHVAKP